MNKVYEVNILKENGEIDTSNTFKDFKNAVIFYNALAEKDKELVENINDETFTEIFSYFTSDRSGISTIV